MPPFGAVPSVRRTGSSRHAEWYTRAETSGWHFRRRSVPAGHRVRHYWNFTPALAANQHHSRLLAPARQLGCRRDQRLLPWRVTAGLRPRVIVRVPRPAANQLRGKLRTGVRLSAWHTAPPDIRSRSDRASGHFNRPPPAVCLIFPGPRPRRLGTDYRRGAGLIFHDFGIRRQGPRPRRLGTDYRPAVLRSPTRCG